MYKKTCYIVIALLTYVANVERLKKSNGTSTCGRDVGEFLSDLGSGKYWASVMYDASAKVPNGLLQGNLINMGQFDECVQVEHPFGHFTGQHCMLRINLTSKVDKHRSNIYKVIRPFEEENKYDKFWKMQYGLCVPSTCTVSDISKGINSILNKDASEEVISVTLNQENCRTKDPRKMTGGGWTAVGIFSVLGVVVLLSTIHDLCSEFLIKKNEHHPLLTSFSIYKNGKTLFQITENSEQFKALHGIRVLSMYWIILLHGFEYVWTQSPIVNFFDYTKHSHDISHLVLYNGIVAVDTFYFLGGLLVSLLFFRDLGKKGYYDVPLSYIHRYLRLTPSYAFMILITANIFIHLGDGPLWESINGPEMERCQQYWWSGLLYVQNFVNPNSMCMSVSWYLSTDMQFYWLAPFLLYPVYIWSSYAALIFGLALAAAIITNFGIAFANDLGANHITHPDYQFQFVTDYVKFYMRAAPYVIGLAMGYVIHRIKTEKIQIKLNKVSVMIGWLIATGLCLLVIYGTEPFTKNKLSTLEGALFLCLHRAAWGIGLCWITFACLNGYGGPVNAFLSWNFFQPLSKLTYNVFFLHRAVQYYRFGNYRTNTYAGDYEITNDFFSDLITSNLIAIPFTLICEMPFGHIDRYLFKNVRILPLPRPKSSTDTIVKEMNSECNEIEKLEKGRKI